MMMIAASAALGLAGVVPRDVVTHIEVVYATEYVTVDAGAPTPTPTPSPVVEEKKPDPNVIVYTTVITQGDDGQQHKPIQQKPKSSSSSSAAAVVSPTASPTATGGQYYAAPSDLVSAGILFHNKHRDNHSVSALTWSDKLAGYAAESAKKCDMEHDL